MHQKGNYQDFLKRVGLFLGHAFIIINWIYEEGPTQGIVAEKFRITQ